MHSLLILAGVHLLSAMTPGPDFFMVIRNSLVYGRKTGLMTGLGISVGILVHCAYTFAGVGFIISQSIYLFNAIKILGALYLLYIGYSTLMKRGESQTIDQSKEKKQAKKVNGFKTGFLTNILNPKATLYFVALFSQFVTPEISYAMMLTMTTMVFVLTFVWWGAVTYFLTLERVGKAFSKIHAKFEKGMGIILTGLGWKIIFSQD